MDLALFINIVQSVNDMSSKNIDPEKGFWRVIVEVDKKFILMTDKDGVVSGFESERQGCESFERAYDRGHSRGYEGSMSACLHFVFYQPSIVYFANTEAVKKILKEPIVLISSWSAAGSMYGLQCKVKETKAIWNKGTKPKLI